MSQLAMYLGLGLAAGVLYAGVGIGVVTTFKATGVVNLAQVGFGMWGAFTFAVLRQDGQLVLPIPGVPTPSLGAPVTTWTALVIALAMTALLGAGSYLLVFRPLRQASTVANLVASTGLLAVIQSLIVLQFGTSAVPVDRFLPQGTLRIAGAAIPVDRVWAAATTIVLAAALAAWFRWSRTGLASRGASESQLRVALARWSPDRLALIGWILGATVSATLTILVSPAVSLSPIAFGLLIVPGLAAALIGRLSSVLAACAGGLVLGMVQAEISNLSTKQWWPDWARVGVAQLVPFVAVVLALMLLGRRLPFRGEPVGARLPAVAPARPRVPVVAVAAGFALVALLVTSGTYRFGLITSMALAVLTLSVVVLTGLIGQLSLAQAAVAGVGGFALAKLGGGVPFPLDLLGAALIASVAGTLIGAPALRIRGAQLTIVSMAGAVALESLVFRNPAFTSQAGEPIEPARLPGLDLAIRRGDDIARLSFGITVLVVLVVASCSVACIAAGRTGRRFLAVRGDERAAAAAGVDVARTKLIAVAASSFLAGLAGGLFGLVRGQLTAESFTLFVGIAVVAFAAIGGITRVAGAIIAGAIGSLGIVYVVLDDTVSFGKWYGLIAGIALVVSIIRNPTGLAGKLEDKLRPLLDRLRRSRRSRSGAGCTVVGPRRSGVTADMAATFPRPGSDCALAVTDLRVAYGGVVAVDHVSLRVRGGQILGLVGPNGAGKTSLIDGICGFTPSSGSIELDGTTLERLRPHARQHAGLGRTWQDGRLFDDLTVIDNLAVAAERARPGDLGRDLISAAGIQRERLLAILDAWGIADHADRRPGVLSVGRRKLVDVARAVAGDPAVLLADEPAAGLDSREGDELARRLRAYADSGRAVVLIEHDLALVRRICDEIHVLDFGATLAAGKPGTVLADPRVATAFLGDVTGGSGGRHLRKPPGRLDSPTRRRGGRRMAASTPSSDEVLGIEQLRAGYGDLNVLRDVDLTVGSGEIVAVLGPNGAGKSTLLLTIAGVLAPGSGGLRLLGTEERRSSVHHRARQGLGFVPAGSGLFPGLTVRENIRIRSKDRTAVDRAIEFFPQLEVLTERRAGLLSGGEQQMLALAAVLVTRPRLLLIDEMSMGLAPLVVQSLLPIIRDVADREGVGVLLVEQHIHAALQVSDRVAVLNRGRIVHEAPSASAREDPAQLTALYLSEGPTDP